MEYEWRSPGWYEAMRAMVEDALTTTEMEQAMSLGSVPVSRAEYDRLYREKIEEAKKRFAQLPLDSLELQWVGDQLAQYRIEEQAAIQPALSPEEWSELLAGRAVFNNCVEAEYDGESVTLREESDCLADGAVPRELDITKREKHFVIAVLNATMWDGDPRKITREKVDALESLIDRYVPSVSAESLLTDALIASLRALLPPE